MRAPKRPPILAVRRPPSPAMYRQMSSYAPPFPTSDDLEEVTAAILIQKRVPRDIRPGEPFEYVVRVTNQSDATVQSVVLVESLLSMLTIEGSSPASQLDEPHSGRWTLGPIMPSESVDVRIAVRGKQPVPFRSHTQFSYSSAG